MTQAPLLLELYRRMATIRRAEERLSKLFADGEVPGFLHLSIGQEAVPVGVCAALERGDTVASTHRGHGHALAKGMALEGFFAEIMGRASGVCAGRGGSIHVADMSIGMLGANGIVGGGLPLATGSALAHQVKGRPNVAVAFFGDGAMAEGALHECLNLARLWQLPLVFVCENNGWGEFSPHERQFAAKLAALGAAFAIPYEEADGTDVEAVAAAARRRVEPARRGEGPQILECRTPRWRGHYEGDPQKYREPSNLDAARGQDALALAAARLAAQGVDAEALGAIERAITERIEAAVAAARAAAEPDFAAAVAGVYAEARAHA
ncbi:MAG: thiamine pyrophosphate-dependent dehydrogenase E1 component subunit alpha [Betaproteobacteria bacterium]|nr:MAG: thiamine pyrophosphate-dependent dehydrogenase E1 component subunit alpha [Betaproteobacteria bacterium]